jgi:hemerythrin-like domain-containing protein
MEPNPRRRFLALSALTLAGSTVTAVPSVVASDEAEPVSTNEDLMREHGVLKRVLLIYRTAIDRLQGRQDLPVDALHKSADLIRRFIEEYHELLEEQYLFPRFEKANQQVDLVRTLRLQHERGRQRTASILQLTKGPLQREGDKRRLADDLQLFVRMYAPHEAREDTVLFPAFKKIVSPHEYASLGEAFEKQERQKFGGDGFDMAVDQVADLEKTFGIYDLAQFTPPPG